MTLEMTKVKRVSFIVLMYFKNFAPQATFQLPECNNRWDMTLKTHQFSDRKSHTRMGPI